MEMEEKQKVQQQQPEEAEEVEEEEEEEELEEEEEPGMETAGAQQIRGQHEEDDNMEEDSGSERESERERAERELKAERERKKAEVRRRLEEAGRAKKAKKGFLTPERKKKLRKLLMLKATEDLKLQQKKRAEERQKVLNERIPSMPSELENMNDDDLLILAEEFRGRIISLESEIYDLSYMSRMKDFEINELTIAVNDLRGKFVKPTLKRISKTDTQFDKIKKQNQAKVDYRSTLKTREGNKFTLEETDNTCGRVDEMIKRMEKRGSNPAAVPPND